MPSAPGGFHGVDHPIAVQAALLVHHERQRIALEIDGVLAGCDPLQTFRPCGDPAAFACVTLKQRDVEFTALERTALIHAETAPDIQPQPSS